MPCGLSFPFRFVPDTGGFASASGVRKIRENVWQLLLTELNERAMRRDLGVGLHALLHEPLDQSLALLLDRRLRQSIATAEPRVEIVALAFRREGAVLWVDLLYAVDLLGAVEQLSVPVEGP